MSMVLLSDHVLTEIQSSKLEDETVLPEDGADERRNASECQVKQHALVYERWCINCWFTEDKIK